MVGVTSLLIAAEGVLDGLSGLAADGTRIGTVIFSVLLGNKMYGSAMQKANDRYKLTAEEADRDLAKYRKEAKAEREELLERIDQLDSRVNANAAQLATCRAESKESAAREAELMERIEHLEGQTTH